MLMGNEANKNVNNQKIMMELNLILSFYELNGNIAEFKKKSTINNLQQCQSCVYCG